MTMARVRVTEAFSREVEARVNGLSDREEGHAIWKRLRRGPELLGRTDALEQFRLWRAPDERAGE
jgi:hypothetical protein